MLRPSQVATLLTCAALVGLPCQWLAWAKGRTVAPPAPDLADGQAAKVAKVIDGDTLDLTLPDGRTFRLRVRGIDCPESKANPKCRRGGAAKCRAEVPRGQEATVRARAMAAAGASVRIEGPAGRDRYGRALGYVRLPDGRDFGLALVQAGLCLDYSKRYPHPRSEAYRAAQAQVRRAP